MKSRQHEPKGAAARPGSLELHALVADMRQKIRQFEITPDQLFGPELSDLVRYRDPATGNTWNGRGRPPNWIRGKDRDRFSVE